MNEKNIGFSIQFDEIELNKIEYIYNFHVYVFAISLDQCPLTLIFVTPKNIYDVMEEHNVRVFLESFFKK